MPLTRSSSATWIFPLIGSDAPFKKHIQDLQSYESEDELVMSASTLEAFKVNSNSPSAHFTFEEARAKHQESVKHVVLKDMGPPFGKAAFSGEQGFKMLDNFGRRNFLIYSGLYLKESQKAPADGIYTASLTKSFKIDGKNTNNLTRYFQDLPDMDDPLDANYVNSLKEDVAVENFNHYIKYFSITLEGCDYVIPMSSLFAACDVDANEIFGFTYGPNYWHTRKIVPSLFNRQGEPISMVTLEIYTEKKAAEKERLIRIGIYKDAEVNILQDRYIWDPHTIFVLPPEIKVLSEGRANSVFIPALYAIDSLNKRYIGYRGCKPGISFESSPEQASALKAAGLELPFTTFLDPFAEEPSYRIYINIEDISRLTPLKAERAFAVLNASMKVKDECQFSVFMGIGYRKELNARVSKSTQSFFAASRMPALEVVEPRAGRSMQI